MTKKIWTVLLAAGATAVWAGPFSVAAQETETLTEYTMETLHVASEETEHSKETELLEETEFSEKAELSEEQRQEYVSAYRDALGNISSGSDAAGQNNTVESGRRHG